MTKDEEADWVAEKARETFEKIKELRKSMPQKFAWQREALDKKIKELQAQWWKDCKPHFGHKNDDV